MKIGILGSGSWGTGIAVQLAKNNEVMLWEFDKDLCEKLKEDKENKKFLPGITLPTSLLFTNDIHELIEHNEMIIFAIPSHVLRQVAHSLKEFNLKSKHLISLVKGLEDKTYKRMTEIIAEEISEFKTLSALSGPSHAEEVARNIPSTVILANPHLEQISFLLPILSTDTFRVYSNSDIVGVELGGAVKNIIAIAAGISDGLNFGANTKAALITRGIEEIKRLAITMGAQENTLYGLSGIGDLITTCISPFSRNRHVGEELGRGKSLDDILNEMIMVAEGVATTKAIYNLSQSKNISMPITESVYNILYNNALPKDEVISLMNRPFKEEFE